MQLKKKVKSNFSRAIKDESGQVLVWLALSMVALLGMVSLSVDLGHAYYVRCALQSSSNAAALAGAQALPNATAAIVATNYSSVAGAVNVNPTLPTVTMVAGYPQVKCIVTLTKEGLPCLAPAAANAVVVSQQADVPMFFAQVFGYNSLTVSATATASMGGNAAPLNVAIIVDTTGSMGTNFDSDPSCNDYRIHCALAGVRVLLAGLSPCASSLSNCGAVTDNGSSGGGNVANSVQRVSLFTFPNVTVGTAKNDYTGCGATNPTILPYTTPSATATSYAPSTGTYQIVNFSSDYRSSDNAKSLATGSDMVLAVGGKSNCGGMQAPGGELTYYAGVVYAAQAALVAEKAANPGSNNIMIILGDGDSQTQSISGTLPLTTSGAYPSLKNQCAQAITAAQVAKDDGTLVYTVAYGAASSGCMYDNPAITPCQTMQRMASPSYFYSDYKATGGTSTCVGKTGALADLNSIFGNIVASIPSYTRLIPNGLP